MKKFKLLQYNARRELARKSDMIAITSRILGVLQAYRVFLAAVGLTWIAVAIGVFRTLNVLSIQPSTLMNITYMFPVGFLAYLIYASFYGVYAVSRQISEVRREKTIIMKLRAETFLAILVNAAISSFLIDHLIDEYGTRIHAMVLIALLITASSFTRHPTLRRVVNFFRKRLFPSFYETAMAMDNK